jgi:hypothetical protein
MIKPNGARDERELVRASPDRRCSRTYGRVIFSLWPGMARKGTRERGSLLTGIRWRSSKNLSIRLRLMFVTKGLRAMTRTRNSSDVAVPQ